MASSSFFPSLTKISHTQSYPAISPTRPELSAKGKTIVITGGGSGIGASIARAFAAGGSCQIAIISRTEAKLLATKSTIEEQYPGTNVLAITADINNAKQLNDAFKEINKAFGEIELLVANSATMPTPRPLLDPSFDAQDWWSSFTTNVLGALNTIRAFAPHATSNACILHISTAIAHMPPLEPGVSSYAASKMAATKMFDYLALEKPEWHIVNVHPGLVDTDMSRKSGHGGCDHIDLSGNFCLWLTSPEAEFLRSKFVWVNWDVDELIARKEEVTSTDLLDTKLGGVSFVGWEMGEL